MQRVHTTHPNCPFCQAGFNNLSALKKHIESYHKESEPISRPSVITQKVTGSKPQAICVFNLQPNGCKKGLNCDFSHEIGSHQQNVMKVPKNCDNGPSCRWKPRCRYIHEEEGETIPRRAPRTGGRGSQVKNCFWSATECPRGGPGTCSYAHVPQVVNQGFPTIDVSQPPPITSMAEFPGLPPPVRPSVFRINPQHM